jgi:hypothetical protein
VNRMTRRQILGGSFGIALGTTAAAPTAAAEDMQGEGTPLVLGPFAIDKWFLKTVKSSPLGGPLEPLSTPKYEDVARVLAGCRVYILDRRISDPGKEARFADGYPKAVVEGKLAAEWKDSGKTYALDIAEVSVSGTDTNYDKKPPARAVGRLTVTIHLRGSDGRDSAEAVYHFSSERPAVVYDVTGAHRDG